VRACGLRGGCRAGGARGGRAPGSRAWAAVPQTPDCSSSRSKSPAPGEGKSGPRAALPACMHERARSSPAALSAPAGLSLRTALPAPAGHHTPAALSAQPPAAAARHARATRCPCTSLSIWPAAAGGAALRSMQARMEARMQRRAGGSARLFRHVAGRGRPPHVAHGELAQAAGALDPPEAACASRLQQSQKPRQLCRHGWYASRRATAADACPRCAPLPRALARSNAGSRPGWLARNLGRCPFRAPCSGRVPKRVLESRKAESARSSGQHARAPEALGHPMQGAAGAWGRCARMRRRRTGPHRRGPASPAGRARARARPPHWPTAPAAASPAAPSSGLRAARPG